MKRFSIYFAGFLVIAIIIYLNSFNFKEIFLVIDNMKEKPIPELIIHSGRSYEKKEIEITLAKDQIINHPEIAMVKTFLPFIGNTRKFTSSQARLSEMLFKGNSTSYPNGSLFSCNGTVYLMERGELRPIESRKLFEDLGFDWAKVKKISSEDFSAFSLGSRINENDLDEEYPEGIIFKTDKHYFITGSKNVYKIFSKELIEGVWPDFNYVNTGAIPESEGAFLSCSQSEQRKIVCYSNAEKLINNSGNIYYFKIFGMPSEIIEKISVRLVDNPGILESLAKTKGLFW